MATQNGNFKCHAKFGVAHAVENGVGDGVDVTEQDGEEQSGEVTIRSVQCHCVHYVQRQPARGEEDY